MSRAEGRSPAILAGVIVIAALFVLLCPTPATIDQLRRTQVAFSGAPVRATGNSVITHRSKCDADTRTLPQMMGAGDLSFPGQTLSEGLNLTGVSIKARPGRTNVMLVSLSQLATIRREDLRGMAFFRAAGSKLEVNQLGARIASLAPITSGPEQHQGAFTYRGVAYPAYDKLKTQYLLPERLAQGCPETLGKNRAFIEALYWNNYLRLPLRPDYWRDIATLIADSRAKGGRTIVALMPVDFADAETLRPAFAAELRARRDAARAAAGAAGIPLLDLSEGFRPDDFADRWCGCGHLSDRGRLKVADAVRAAIGGPR